MSIAISSVSSIAPTATAQSTSAAVSSPANSGSFASALEGAIQAVDQTGRQADTAVQKFLNGEGEELHNVALSVQRASLAFDFGLQVRNKIVSAYQEVMKMQI